MSHFNEHTLEMAIMELFLIIRIKEKLYEGRIFGF